MNDFIRSEMEALGKKTVRLVESSGNDSLASTISHCNCCELTCPGIFGCPLPGGSRPEEIGQKNIGHPASEYQRVWRRTLPRV